MGQTPNTIDTLRELDLEPAAKELWSLMNSTDNSVLRREYACNLAGILGTPGELHKYICGCNAHAEQKKEKLINSFRDNVKLLLYKTWVEKDDETRRDATIKLLDKLVELYSEGNWPQAIKRLLDLSGELAWLLFGESLDDPSFMEYISRIDIKLGLFYWFISQLKEKSKTGAELTELCVLVAVYALASF